MNIFPHEKKVDIGVLPRVEASSRFRHHAQAYRFPNRSLVRKTRQGFRYHKKSKNKSRIYILMFRTANIYMRFKNKSWIDILWFLDVCFGYQNSFCNSLNMNELALIFSRNHHLFFVLKNEGKA